MGVIFVHRGPWPRAETDAGCHMEGPFKDGGTIAFFFRLSTFRLRQFEESASHPSLTVLDDPRQVRSCKFFDPSPLSEKYAPILLSFFRNGAKHSLPGAKKWKN